MAGTEVAEGTEGILGVLRCAWQIAAVPETATNKAPKVLKALTVNVLRDLEQSGRGCGHAVNFQFVRVEKGWLPVLFVLFPLISKPTALLGSRGMST